MLNTIIVGAIGGVVLGLAIVAMQFLDEAVHGRKPSDDARGE